MATMPLPKMQYILYCGLCALVASSVMAGPVATDKEERSADFVK